MNKTIFLLIIFIIITPTYIVIANCSYASDTSILDFSKNSPTLLSILLASVLASLAVILGMLGLDELREIQRIEAKNKKKIFDTLMKNLEWDIAPILFSFIVSSILSIFLIRGTYLIIPILDYSIEIYRVIFVVNFILLSISLISTYDIIRGLFNVSRIKYQSIKNKIEVEN